MLPIELEAEIRANMDHPPACEGPAHPTAEWGHVPEQAASFVVFLPCAASYLCCAGRVKFYELHRNDRTINRYITCMFCGSRHWIDELTWTEIL